MLTNNAKEVQATPPSHFEVPIVILSDNIWVRWAPKLIWYPWNLSDLVIWVVGVSCSHWYKQWGVTKIWAKNIPELKMLSIWSKTASSQKYFIGFPDPVVRITLKTLICPKHQQISSLELRSQMGGWCRRYNFVLFVWSLPSYLLDLDLLRGRQTLYLIHKARNSGQWIKCGLNTSKISDKWRSIGPSHSSWKPV